MRRRSTTLNPTTWPAARLLARYGPPAMLVAVALFQDLLVQRYDLSPWKGGGFGMFSTVDDPRARFLRLYLETDRGELPVPVPAELAHAVRELQTLPTPKRLRRLAGGLVGAKWAVQEQPWIDLERLDRDSEPTRDEASNCARRAGRGALAPLPRILAWATLAIEGLVALAFAGPARWPLGRLRAPLLFAFVLSTYALAPVIGFGWILLILGLAQAPDRGPIPIA